MAKSWASSRWLVGVIAVVVVAAAAVWLGKYGISGAGNGPAADINGTIKIGVVLPLTGNYAEYGQNVLPALQLVADELNRQGGPKVSLLVQDDQAQPKQAVSALQKLIQVDGVRFVIGGFTSASSIAMYPIAERAGVLMFSSSSSTPSLTKNTPPNTPSAFCVFAMGWWRAMKKWSIAKLRRGRASW